jgi:hypothetical protein
MKPAQFKLAALCLAMALIALAGGCASKPKPYGDEEQLFLPGTGRMVWAVAPTLNISGQSQIDPLLQSDLLFQQLQQTEGLTVIPVDKVVEVYSSLKIEKIESEQQALTVCNLLGCDALIVPTITAFDPYDPPKFGGSLQLFTKPQSYKGAPRLDVHQLELSPAQGNLDPIEQPKALLQVVRLFDAADGTVRDRVKEFAAGRSDPNGPLGEREIVLSMDRYCGFCYHELLIELFGNLNAQSSAVDPMGR